MSLKAILWALEDAPVDDPSQLIVLIALADRASDDGSDAYPARPWIAHRARVSVRTVTRRLKELESLGLIRRGDQSLLDRRGIDPDRRPVVWDLNLQMKRGDNLSPGDTQSTTGCHTEHDGVSENARRGDTVGTQTVLNHPEPSLNRRGYSEAFELWWKTFPKAPGRTPPPKSAAWEQYRKIVRKCGDEFLLSQLQAYIPTVDKPKFFMNPNKWLKEGYWEVEYETVVNPLDEAIANRDVEAVYGLSGLRFREPEELVVLPLSERSVARREAFDRWALERRDDLVAGWRSKAGV